MHNGEKLNSVTDTWRLLYEYNKECRHTIAHLFEDDSDRFKRFSASSDGLLLDYSKTRLDDRALGLLLKLADAACLSDHIQNLLDGQLVNLSEQRPALHSALRATDPGSILGQEQAARVIDAKQRMLHLASQLNDGRIPGSNSPVTDIIHIGIGGSSLGPELVGRALAGPRSGKPQVHFLASADGHGVQQLTSQLDPHTSVLVVASKSFTTSETMLNCKSLTDWMSANAVASVNERMIAITARPERALELGLTEDNILPVWDWVGGRFSVWSAMGLPAACLLGSEGFTQFLAGGEAMDNHFRSTPLRQNLPVLLALIGIWHRNICAAGQLAVMPYDLRLKLLPDWLQQLDMESNGKSITQSGEVAGQATAPVILGGCGTASQHSVFQAIHQGSELIPVEFIGVINPDHGLPDHQRLQLAHLLAQSEALAMGRDAAQTAAQLAEDGMSESEIQRQLASRVFWGNRPTITLLLDRLSPYSLGQLMALYEHKIFVQSVLWEINAFDQWGVELGKTVASGILAQLQEQSRTGSDGPPASLLDYVRHRTTG